MHLSMYLKQSDVKK